MAYDEEFADRLRELLAGESGVVEKRMFGGLAFLVDGHMSVTATSGGLMLRVDRAQTEALAAEPKARRFVMRGREMNGWLLIDLDARASDDELRRWVRIGVDYARTLPPK